MSSHLRGLVDETADRDRLNLFQLDIPETDKEFRELGPDHLIKV